jgi:hypothetical protein
LELEEGKEEMFTIKHIIKNGDDMEVLYQAKHVTMRGGEHKHTDESSGLRLFEVNGDDNLAVTLSAPGSVAFVMNENGATIARYDL